MATNIEKKITKQMKLSAIIDYFDGMDADATVDLATIKVDGQEQEAADHQTKKFIKLYKEKKRQGEL